MSKKHLALMAAVLQDETRKIISCLNFEDSRDLSTQQRLQYALPSWKTDTAHRQ
jgi:hypothetical protein